MLPRHPRSLTALLALLCVAYALLFSAAWHRGKAKAVSGEITDVPATTLELPLSSSLAVPELPAPEALTLDLFRPSSIIPPALAREFRGAWIATVGNIDWPSKPGLSPEAQRAELIGLLDRAAALRLNAIILQVRPACDALYASKFEPWSPYLTGTMGKAPQPFYDPLEFAVTEAHKRGLELHAWFNPFRALTTARNVAGASTSHITRTHPQLVRRYGDLFWLDPGEAAARQYSIDVIADVVRRYDVDAVHVDDYFYPYPTKDKQGRVVDFPDEPSWKQYLAGGGTMVRGDWRRENINTFVRELYERVKNEKKWVKLGISPFGIWRPQKQPLISGLDSFQEIYADSRKWLENGWLDYLAPQLYWSSDAPKQNYSVLLQWWAEANRMQRHLWPGIATDRIGAQRPASDILNQIAVTRSKLVLGAGNIHWHFKSLLENVGQVSDRLSAELYAEPALVPTSSWLGSSELKKPEVTFADNRLSWSAKGSTAARRWAVQTRRDGKWTVELYTGSETSRVLEAGDLPDAVAVTAFDRLGNSSPVSVLERADTAASVVAVQARAGEKPL